VDDYWYYERCVQELRSEPLNIKVFMMLMLFMLCITTVVLIIILVRSDLVIPARKQEISRSLTHPSWAPPAVKNVVPEKGFIVPPPPVLYQPDQK
jgi:hypothetical protein